MSGLDVELLPQRIMTCYMKAAAVFVLRQHLFWQGGSFQVSNGGDD